MRAKRYTVIHKRRTAHPRAHHALIGKGRKCIIIKRGKGFLGSILGRIPILGGVFKTIFY